MAKRSIPGINAGSTADIAFLLLIFYLVTTTMDSDMGIVRKLPPMVEDNTSIEIKKRNLLPILVNRDNNLMVKGDIIALSELRKVAKEFIENPENNENLPEIGKIHIKELGDVYTTTQHVISLMNDRGTNYKTYVTVQNELAAAYNELRDEFSMKKWGIHYTELEKTKREAVDKVYPLRVSEADPVELALLN